MKAEFTAVMTFDNENKAHEALKELRQWHTHDIVKAFNAAVLLKDKHGQVSIKETENVDAKHGALSGAITGGQIGWLPGTPGMIVGAAAGTGTGGVAARLLDLGFPRECLRDLQDSLQPGSSALVMMIEPSWIDGVVKDLAQWDGRTFRVFVDNRTGPTLKITEFSKISE